MVSLVHYASSLCFLGLLLCRVDAISYSIQYTYTCVCSENEFLWIVVEERRKESKSLEFFLSVLLSMPCVCSFQRIDQIKMATNCSGCLQSAGNRPNIEFMLCNHKLKIKLAAGCVFSLHFPSDVENPILNFLVDGCYQRWLSFTFLSFIAVTLTWIQLNITWQHTFFIGISRMRKHWSVIDKDVVTHCVNGKMHEI